MMDFRSFASAHGLVIRDLISDGRVHRVQTDDHPRKKNGAYSFDGSFGWIQDWSKHQTAIIFKQDDSLLPNPAEMARIKREAAARDREQAKLRAAVALEARRIIERCQYSTHPYLARKGFPDERVLIDTDGRMVVPMRPAGNYSAAVSSLQHIAADGTKRFLRDGGTRDCVFHIGAATAHQRWICEGYATALSLDAALRGMYRQDMVVVCFSAGNLTRVAAQYGPQAFVIADHDASGTGEAAARATGLKWAMPDEIGDANDLHQAKGLSALKELIRSLL